MHLNLPTWRLTLLYMQLLLYDLSKPIILVHAPLLLMMGSCQCALHCRRACAAMAASGVRLAPNCRTDPTSYAGGRTLSEAPPSPQSRHTISTPRAGRERSHLADPAQLHSLYLCHHPPYSDLMHTGPAQWQA